MDESTASGCIHGVAGTFLLFVVFLLHHLVFIIHLRVVFPILWELFNRSN